MDKYDILITYEIRNREIESVCLLKYELERRGYTVKLQPQYDTYFAIPEPIEAELVIVPAYYRERAMFYASSHLLNTNKIFNMQWEQLFRNMDMKGTAYLKSIKEWGRSAVHVAWGENMRNRMLGDWQVPEKNVKLTGHMTMDFLRGRLAGYYADRKTVFEQFDIPADRRVSLFISSFTYQTMHERFLRNMGRSNESGVYFDPYAYRDISIRSQEIVLEWFDRILTQTDDIIVYRPHPEEKDSPLLAAMQKKHANFRVINQLSVKQWILVADRVFTWVSTALAETFVAGKECAVLRPVEIPEHIELCLYNNAQFVTTYEGFERTYKSEHCGFPVSAEEIAKYYYVPQDSYSYQLVCDAIEEVYHSDSYRLDKPMTNPFYPRFLNAERIKNYIKRAVARMRLCQLIHDRDWLNGTKLRENIDDVIYVRDKLKKQTVSEEEIAAITANLHRLLDDGSAKPNK